MMHAGTQAATWQQVLDTVERRFNQTNKSNNKHFLLVLSDDGL